MGFIGWLSLSFIVLKIVGFIHWSWWWVLSPIWISVGFIIVIAIIAAVSPKFYEAVHMVIGKYLQSRWNDKRR